ncbi:hypothetical protein NPIL_667451 [Nephila pilipes]|uniref:Uncharacterized protein n=1 Tax=Nephila pilipes TaxID=299642 RepID=A0A8X6MRG7_NEPPI|nr:hypothetical protein NPIL_667451 [Nephila pilipes]
MHKILPGQRTRGEKTLKSVEIQAVNIPLWGLSPLGCMRVTPAAVKSSSPGFNNVLDSKLKKKKGWIPVTKLGKLLKNGRIKSLEEIRKYSFPIAEREIIELFKRTLESDGVKMRPTQERTRATHRTRFKDNKSQNWRS